jgi:hypothetical protein
MNKTEARKIWKDLANDFELPDVRIRAILEDDEHWTSLGYMEGPAGFADCWVDHMSTVEVAKAVAPLIVQEMIRADWNDDAIAHALRGVGPAHIKAYRLRRERGDLTTIPIEHAPPSGWYFDVGIRRRALADQSAMDRHGTNSKEILQSVIAKAVDELIGTPAE